MSTSVSPVSNHFPSAENGFSTTTSGAVSSGATTVGLTSASGYTNGETVVFVIDPDDSTKKQTFTGTIDTATPQVTGVVWTAGTNQTHAAGATVVDYVTATHISMITKGLLVQHKQDGTHANTITTDTINENTAAAGVTLDSVLHKDGGVLILNDVAYQAKNSSGTAKDLIKLESDNFLRLSQIPYQSNTTNSTAENILIEHGWGFIVGDDTGKIEETVTFQNTFAAAPLVFLQQIGSRATSTSPTGTDTFTSSVSTTAISAQVSSTSTTNFVANFQLADSGNFSSSNNYGYTWIAIGTKT